MKAFILVFLLFAGVYGCLDSPSNCSCPSILNITELEVPEQFENGECTFIMNCLRYFTTAAMGSFNSSTIPRPADSADGSFFMTVAEPTTVPAVDRVNLREAFGIVCENGSWIATKFPFGIQYSISGSGFGSIPANELNGKGFKANLIRINCA